MEPVKNLIYRGIRYSADGPDTCKKMFFRREMIYRGIRYYVTNPPSMSKKSPGIKSYRGISYK